ncbi:MAG TPA: DNA adenine methylase [Armatimonadota bacterium]|nr:DNA adenine methylase [Armatimonadota bacterium]
MNYIGSKYSLLPDIQRVLDNAGVPKSGTALDLFAGTGIVAQYLKVRGHITYANDWQHYSYLTCVAYLEHNGLPEFAMLLDDAGWSSRIYNAELLRGFPTCSVGPATPIPEECPAARVLSYLSQIPGTPGPFYQAYCEGGSAGRQYFSSDNGQRIQAIRDQVEMWGQDRLVSHEERAWLIASLLEGSDRVANTASVYGAYLKHIKRSAQRPLQLYVPIPPTSVYSPECHRAFCADSEDLLDQLSNTHMRLVYIDPPYNSRQYNANYHILETVARWDLDKLNPRGVTGLRASAENRSDYCLKSRVMAGFSRLLSKMNADYVLFSYNNEGLVSKPDLEELFSTHCCAVHVEEIPYKRFRADLDSSSRVYKGDSTMEYLILGRFRRADVGRSASTQQVSDVSSSDYRNTEVVGVPPSDRLEAGTHGRGDSLGSQRGECFTQADEPVSVQPNQEVIC